MRAYGKQGFVQSPARCNQSGLLRVLQGVQTLSKTTDQDIAAMIVRDLDRGFVAMVEAHQPGIYSGALRLLRRRHDAEDVAQETFLRAYRSLESYGDDRIRSMKLRPWLWTIAINLCRNRWSRTKPTAPLDSVTPVASRDEEPLDFDSWSARLDQLSDPQRTAVVLRHVVDLSIAEIAEITERPQGTVKADISRGLSRLRTAIESEEAT